jgi:sulfatase maturation enzyme AslB (radical SAM superfamily)
MSKWIDDSQRVFIEITNRCNFDCIFCPLGISERARQDMDLRLAFSLIDQLQELGFNRMIYFHVLGEPLLHPSVFDVVDHVAEAGMRPILFTNGGALTDKIVQRVLASKAGELLISMQTINRQSYEMLRKTPFDWGTYLSRIQAALAAANEAEDGCVFRVSMGIKKTDTSHPEELYFAEYESLERIKESIAAIFSQVEGIDLTEAFSALDARGSENMPIIHISDCLSLSVKPMGNWRRIWRDEPVSSGHCPIFGKELAVLSSGDVTFCHIDYDGRAAIGNVAEKPLMDIINTPQVEQMAADFISGISVPRGCEYCRGVKTKPEESSG